ncbi:TCR/Tet family MFS transporter [Frigidibacter sp. ROC022]|uniref:TCR/Tet family MFS transporter n=1 Tax=Frigidibacter sp. ROC022 TaxID=2971796 RepID=UPI00215AF3B8|nr:TCR/Tet family MFS transporter [Frigidibacter sp. ROC022]MCR8722793.1 TCR/Tet family MFS transporter [Frigidibacter sp. ROC022]
MPLALVFILLTVALDAIGIGLIFPVMPDLMRDVLHEGLANAAVWGGVLAAAFSVMQFVFGPVIGNLSDRYGRRPIMLIALATMALDYAVMALAQSVWLLLAGRIIAGITAATAATATAYVADVSAPEARARNFGLIGAAFGIGFVLGPMIGGAASVIDIRAPFAIAAALAGVNFVFGCLALPESLAPGKRRAFSWRRANPLAAFRAIGRLPGLRRYLVLIFLFTLAMTSYPAIWSYYGAARFGWDGWWIGISLTIFGLSMALTQAFLVAPAIRAWGETRTGIYGMMLDTVVFVLLGLIRSGSWALALTPVSALSGVAGPAIQGLMANATPDDQQGELQGVLGSVSAVAMALAPLILTPVFWAFTREGAPIYAPGAPFLLSAGLMVICVAILAGSPTPRVGAAAPVSPKPEA